MQSREPAKSSASKLINVLKDNFMRKNIKSYTQQSLAWFILALSVLVIPSVYPCSIYFTVINNSNKTYDDVKITGPCARVSSCAFDLQKLSPGQIFTYHAEGSVCDCHGKYELNGYVFSKEIPYPFNALDLITVLTSSIHLSKDANVTATVEDGDKVTWNQESA